MDRHINIEGGYNIRDLGGYSTTDGRNIKWRTIFRSGLLTHIQKKGIEKTKKLGIKTICDFRAVEERAASPDKWYGLEEIKSVALPVGEGRPDKPVWLNDDSLSEGESHHLYKANRSYVIKNAHRFRAFFEVLLDESNYPLLFHCTAGKDRTGYASMLLLSALGVDQKTIIEDYLLTNIYLKEFAEVMSKSIAKTSGIAKEKIITIFQAEEYFLNGAIDFIKEEYGTIDNYLAVEMGIGQNEKKQLKSLLLA